MRLTSLHMFLGGAAVALVAIVAINLYANSSAPSTGDIPAERVNTTTAPVERSWFESLLAKNADNISAAPVPARLAGKPVVKKTPPSSVNIIEVTNDGQILSLDLKETTDIESLLPRYPFLAPLAEELHFYRTRPDIFRVPPTIYYAEIVDKKNSQRSFFVRREGSALCGSGGCSTQIYVDNGDGFSSEPFPLSTTPPIYYRNDPQNGFSFFQCSTRSVEEFRLIDGAFQLMPSSPVRPTDIPGCIQPQTP